MCSSLVGWTTVIGFSQVILKQLLDSCHSYRVMQQRSMLILLQFSKSLHFQVHLTKYFSFINHQTIYEQNTLAAVSVHQNSAGVCHKIQTW